MFLLFMLITFSLNLGAVELKISDSDYVETKNHQEDYMFLGERLQFSGESEDLFFLGEELDFSGLSKLGVFSLGRRINISGKIGNGLVAAGRTIDIDGNISSTNMLAAEKINIHNNSQLEGDSFMAARIVNIDGKINGDMKISAAEINIDNVIEGDLNIYAGQLKISENGKIIGNLSYESDQEITAEEAARVTGTIQFEKNEGEHYFEKYQNSYFDKSYLFSLLFKISFIICGLLFLLVPLTKKLEQPLSPKGLISNALWGLIPVFIYPSAFVISILLVITLPLSLALLLGFFPLLFITKIIGITLVGGWITNRFSLNTESRFIYFLIGGVIYSGLTFIPFVGFLLLLLVSSVGCGVLLASLISKKLA
mgnify:FL=1